MPAYSGNGVYIAIDGQDVGAYFKSVKLEPKIETQDVTAGSGTSHTQRAEALRDHSIRITLCYDAGGVNTYIQKLRPGRHTVVFGPEGSASGKPKHQQDFVMTAASFEVGVSKTEVVFDLSGDAADAPVVDLFNGGIF